MGKTSRTKGANGERELVRLLKEMGYEARRTAPMQAGQSDSIDGDVEVSVPGCMMREDALEHKWIHDWPSSERWEVKRRKKQFSIQQAYDALEGNDALAVRIDGKPWLVVRRLGE